MKMKLALITAIMTIVNAEAFYVTVNNYYFHSNGPIYLKQGSTSYYPPQGTSELELTNAYFDVMATGGSVATRIDPPTNTMKFDLTLARSNQADPLYNVELAEVRTPTDIFWLGVKLSGVLALTGYGLTLFMRLGKSATGDA